MHIATRGKCRSPPSVTIHLNFWDIVSHRTGALCFPWTGWLGKSPGSPYLQPYSVGVINQVWWNTPIISVLKGQRPAEFMNSKPAWSTPCFSMSARDPDSGPHTFHPRIRLPSPSSLFSVYQAHGGLQEGRGSRFLPNSWALNYIWCCHCCSEKEPQDHSSGEISLMVPHTGRYLLPSIRREKWRTHVYLGTVNVLSPALLPLAYG